MSSPVLIPYTSVDVFVKEYIRSNKYFRLTRKDPQFEDFPQYVRFDMTEEGEIEETVGLIIPEAQFEETVGLELEVVRKAVVEEVVGLEIVLDDA